jgi:hypothetical protein
MEKNQFYSYLATGILGAALVGLYIYIGSYVGNNNTNNDLSKHLKIVGAVTAALTLIYGLLTYFYFMTNLNAVTPYLLISQTVVLWLSLFALSASSIQVSNA